MDSLFIALSPSVANKLDELYVSIYQSIVMLVLSGSLAFIFGLILGVLLIVTKKDGLYSNAYVNKVLESIINLFRSIPFVILLAALIPVSRFIVGSAIGTTGAIVPLVVGTVPFFARQVESVLAQVDKGLIEAAISMGCSRFSIIFRVYLKESIVPLIRAIQITSVSLLGLTAMAGAIGGGGLGDFAIRYGHQRGQTDITYLTVVIILVMVAIIQLTGNLAIKNFHHNK